MSLDLLFDTHSFTWWADESAKLSATASAALEDKNNRLIFERCQHLGDANQSPNRQDEVEDTIVELD